MSIPQINQKQVDTLVNAATTWGGSFSQAIPEEAKDGKEDYEAAMEEYRDTEQLVILGLVKDTSDKYIEKLAALYSMTDHKWRVFEITSTGKLMFDSKDRTIQ